MSDETFINLNFSPKYDAETDFLKLKLKSAFAFTKLGNKKDCA